MRRENITARLLRALSGKTQKELAEEIGVQPSLIAQFELGEVLPSPEHLAGMARSARLTLTNVEEIQRLYETLRRGRHRRGINAEDLLDELAQDLRSRAGAGYRRLLTLPLPGTPPNADDRRRAQELFGRLKDLPQETRSVVIQVAEDYQTWALCERCCDASATEASRKLEDAAAWARLAQEIAERVRGAQEWRSCLRGYAAAHAANVLRVSGELKAADAGLAEAKRLWHSGSDPAGLLDPGRLLNLEAALRRAQRRFDDALRCLDDAVAVGGQPELALIQKGFTLEVMGEYELAVAALLEAEPLVECECDPRLLYMLRFNLAVNASHLGRYGQSAEWLQRVRDLATELGDEIFLIRVTWLEGRVAAGLGRTREARSHLAEARREFGLRGMSYDAALALLEEAVLLLDEGRTAEAKALAGELTKVFDANGVHREALAALRLFFEAAESEEATAELARRVLRYLYRAQRDPELRFEKLE